MPDSGAAADTVPGAGATKPHEIPAAGWGSVLRRVLRHVHEDRLPLLSAGIAFFAVLSIAPVLVTALSVYGAVNTPQQALAQLSDVADGLPPALEQVVADQLTSITTASTQVLTRRGITALLLALWTATAATTSLIDALTLTYHEGDTRSVRQRTGLALLLVLSGALLVGAVIAGLGVVSRALVDAPPGVQAAASAAVWVGLALLMALTLAVLYRVAPDRTRARWHWISWGAGTATVLWVLVSLGLFAYVSQLGTYESTYGSLAGVAISMLWLWATVLLVVLGAVINAETERPTTRDSTVGPEQPRGRRGAVVADDAPPYPED